MKNTSILGFLLLLIFASCQEKVETPKGTFISGKVDNHNEKFLAFQDFLGTGQWEQSIDIQDGTFKVEADVKEPMIRMVSYGNDRKEIFMMPNTSIEFYFDADSLKNTFTFKGDLVAENTVLDTIAEELRNLDYKYVYSQPLDIGAQYLDSVEEKSQSILQDYAKNTTLSPIFVDYASKYIEYHATSYKMFIGDRKDEQPENYYAFLDDVTLTQPELLNIPNYRMFFYTYVEKQTKERLNALDSIQRNMEDAEFKESLKVIEGLENDDMRAYGLFNAMMMKLQDAGINDFMKHYDYFKANNTSKHYKEQLEIAIVEKNAMAPGKAAPEFTITDINGEQVSLSDFKGKYVYVDFWATTCIHCRKETKAYVELHSDYGDKDIEFVSISADLDQDKWRDYIEKEKNVGSILNVTNSWDSEVFRDYQINASPTYVLIDKEGKIIDPVAGRPSSKEIRETFDELLQGD